MITTLSIDLINVICQTLKHKDMCKLVSTCKKLWGIRESLYLTSPIRLGEKCSFIPLSLVLHRNHTKLSDNDKKVIRGAKKVKIQDEIQYERPLVANLTSVRELKFDRSSIFTGLFPKTLEKLTIKRGSYIYVKPMELMLPSSLKSLKIESGIYLEKPKVTHENNVVKGSETCSITDQTLSLPSNLQSLHVEERSIVIDRLPSKLERVKLGLGVKILDKTLPPNLVSFSIEEFDFSKIPKNSEVSVKKTKMIMDAIKLPTLRELSITMNKKIEVLDLRHLNLKKLAITFCSAKAIYLPQKLDYLYCDGNADSLIFPDDCEVTDYDLDCRKSMDAGISLSKRLKQEYIPHKVTNMTIRKVIYNESVTFPEGIKKLTISRSLLEAIPILPEGIEEVTLGTIDCTDESQELVIPSSVKTLILSTSEESVAPKIVVPRTINKLSINGFEVSFK
jgi:hypothetical protein